MMRCNEGRVLLYKKFKCALLCYLQVSKTFQIFGTIKLFQPFCYTFYSFFDSKNNLIKCNCIILFIILDVKYKIVFEYNIPGSTLVKN